MGDRRGRGGAAGGMAPRAAAWAVAAASALLLGTPGVPGLAGQGTAGAAGAGVPPEVRRAAPAAEPDAGERERLLALWARSYFPGRSGDVLLVPEEGSFATLPGVPFMHGSPWEYDTRIPLIVHGPGHIVPGVHGARAGHQEIGATIGALLGLPRRPGTTGRPLREALAKGTPAPPRIVVLLVLDGFRADYLERYAAEAPNLRRLAEGGARFPRARASVLPTATAVAHTTLVTATDPAVHGIVGNGLYDEPRRRSLSSYEGVSAERTMALSLADRWAARTRGRAVIAAQGGTFYPAAALAGRGACQPGGHAVLLAFFDTGTGGWSSNPDCYRLPPYLAGRDIRERIPAGPGGEREAATPAEARVLPDVFPAFEAEATLAMLEAEPFGRDSVTDLLLVNHKAIDYIGHGFGPDSPSMRAAVAAADEQVGRLVEALEEKVGRGGWVLVVTADHGMPGEPREEGQVRRLYQDVLDAVDGRFDPEGSGIALHYAGSDNQLYLDEARMEELGVRAEEVARFLEGLELFRAAFTAEEVARAAGLRLRYRGSTSFRGSGRR